MEAIINPVDLIRNVCPDIAEYIDVKKIETFLKSNRNFDKNFSKPMKNLFYFLIACIEAGVENFENIPKDILDILSKNLLMSDSLIKVQWTLLNRDYPQFSRQYSSEA